VSWYREASRRRFALCVDTITRYAPEGDKVLEVGAAYGFTILTVQSLGLDAYASDMECGIAAYGDAMAARSLPLLAWDLHRHAAPFPAGSMDVVLASEVLEHLQMSLRAAIGKLAACCRPGGLLIITVPNLLRLESWRRMIRGKDPQESFPDVASFERGVVRDGRCHPREPTMSEVVDAFGENNFRVIERRYFSACERSWIKDACYSVVPALDAHCLVVGMREAVPVLADKVRIGQGVVHRSGLNQST